MEEMTNQYRHTPVLLAECLEHLNLKPQHTFVDSTLGGAGHSSEVAKRLGEGGLLIGIDQDEMALAAAKKRLSSASAENACEVMLLRGNFGDLDELLVEAQVPGIDSIRPRRFLTATRPPAAWLLVQGRRLAGHANGPG